MWHSPTASNDTIRPLIDELDFIEDKRRWGYRFRFGLFRIDRHDFELHPFGDDTVAPIGAAQSGSRRGRQANASTGGQEHTRFRSP